MILNLLATIETEEEYNAIVQLYEKYNKRMYAIAMSILHHQQDAEDAVMDALKYMCDEPQMFLRYEDTRTLGLVCMKVKSSAIDIYRKNKKYAARIATLQDDVKLNLHDEVEYDLSNVLIHETNKNILYDAIHDLDDDYKIPILLKYFFLMKSNEIATFMGVTANVVDVRIHRAKKMLKNICVEKGYER